MPSADPPGSAARWRRSDRPEVAWRVSIPWSQPPGANLTVFCKQSMQQRTRPRCIVIAGPALPGRKLATSKTPRMLKPFEIALLQQDLKAALVRLRRSEEHTSELQSHS